jgi:hypothetical protein
VEREENGVSLETLGQGAAVERFNLALQDALDNIQDVNTPAKTKRVVTLKATIAPSEDRDIGNIMVDVSTKLAPIKPFDVRVFMGRDKEGKGRATEYISPQVGLFEEPKPADGKIYKIDKEAKAQ